jgi:hypothetical protein
MRFAKPHWLLLVAYPYWLVEVLNDEEKKIVFSLVDALVGKKKLKDILSSVLTEAK